MVVGLCVVGVSVGLTSTPVILNVVLALMKVILISSSEGTTLFILNSKFISVMIDPERNWMTVSLKKEVNGFPNILENSSFILCSRSLKVIELGSNNAESNVSLLVILTVMLMVRGVVV